MKFHSPPGASGYHHHRGSLPLPLPARHERGEGWGEGHLPFELARLIGIPSPLPSPHSSVVGRGNRPAAWWWCQEDAPSSSYARFTPTITPHILGSGEWFKPGAEAATGFRKWSEWKERASRAN